MGNQLKCTHRGQAWSEVSNLRQLSMTDCCKKKKKKYTPPKRGDNMAGGFYYVEIQPPKLAKVQILTI